MKKTLIKLVVSVGSIALAFSLLTGCNTVKGFGQDVQQGGQQLQQAADSSQHS